MRRTKDQVLQRVSEMMAFRKSLVKLKAGADGAKYLYTYVRGKAPCEWGGGGGDEED